jgi:beta-N-acetylhexosaminidase
MIDEIIRGQIGFDGLLMSDDLDMQALAGSLGDRAEAVLGAGCDVVLQCSGKLDAMREIMPFVSALAGGALRRAEAARAGVSRTITDVADAEAEAEMWLSRITGART